MSLCLIVMMYVLYSLCKIQFNYLKKDSLTYTLYIFFTLNLFFRGCYCGSILFVSYTPTVTNSTNSSTTQDDSQMLHASFVVTLTFGNLSNFSLCAAVICQLFLWIDVLFLIRYQREEFGNPHEIQKNNFNKCEKVILAVLIVFLLFLLAFFVINVVEVGTTNNCVNEYFLGDDIIIYGIMIVVISVIGGIFIKRTKDLKNITFLAHKRETISIFIGAIISFSMKTLSKIVEMIVMPEKMCKIIGDTTDGDYTQDQMTDTQQLFFYYALVNFFVFLISEFVPITAWTILKNPEDYINQYNDLDIP
mmetsp:Transcript_15436/g.15031  ORF Transcript_15436/g.15031 Transcript_15436/m.15031 type:complete len:305 (-) Transcript_15436:155-1069(-)